MDQTESFTSKHILIGMLNRYNFIFNELLLFLPYLLSGFKWKCLLLLLLLLLFVVVIIIIWKFIFKFLFMCYARLGLATHLTWDLYSGSWHTCPFCLRWVWDQLVTAVRLLGLDKKRFQGAVCTLLEADRWAVCSHGASALLSAVGSRGSVLSCLESPFKHRSVSYF